MLRVDENRCGRKLHFESFTFKGSSNSAPSKVSAPRPISATAADIRPARPSAAVGQADHQSVRAGVGSDGAQGLGDVALGAFGARWQAMMKAAAVERLTPAQQWTSIGRVGSQAAAKFSRRGDQGRVGRGAAFADPRDVVEGQTQVRVASARRGPDLVVGGRQQVDQVRGAVQNPRRVSTWLSGQTSRVIASPASPRRSAARPTRRPARSRPARRRCGRRSAAGRSGPGAVARPRADRARRPGPPQLSRARASRPSTAAISSSNGPHAVGGGLVLGVVAIADMRRPSTMTDDGGDPARAVGGHQGHFFFFFFFFFFFLARGGGPGAGRPGRRP